MASNPSLLSEIERDLLDGKPLADLLRKCVLLGARSGSSELREWANRELRGYKGEDNLPKYRIVAAPIQFDAISGNYSITGQVLPEGSLPDFAREEGLGNNVELRQGVGELEALIAGKKPNEGIHLLFPGADVIGQWIDKRSGNPWQHIHNIYWSLMPSTVHGTLDNIRTTLTELIAELNVILPDDQATPTAEQAAQALNVAIHGGSPQINIAAPVTSVQASGNVQGVYGGDVAQTATYNVSQNEAVLSWIAEYQAALLELDEGLRPIVEQQLNQVAAEIAKPEPQGAVVKGLLGSLKSFAQNAIASAGTGAGTLALADVIAHWPFR